MQISLTGQLEEMVNSKEEWIYQLKLEQLKNQLQIGIQQLDAGDSVNGRDFFQKLNQD